MNYLWDEFNIKTFDAETVVYKNGLFQPELSTLNSINIDKQYKKPIHIIYVGEIENENNLEINISVPDTTVFLTAKIINKKPAFFNIYIKNTGKNSTLTGKIITQNYSELKIYEKAIHTETDTNILLNTRVLAHENSNTKLIGIAEINQNCENCDSDIGFSVMAAPNAKIEFFPAQYISSVPKNAGHSASIYKGTNKQIEYLRESGLSGIEVKQVLEEAFLSDI